MKFLAKRIGGAPIEEFLRIYLNPLSLLYTCLVAKMCHLLKSIDLPMERVLSIFHGLPMWR